MSHLWDALEHVYAVLGFERAAGGDEVFRQLVLARIIEPTSKLDSLRVLQETGIAPASYATLKRRLPVFARDGAVADDVVVGVLGVGEARTGVCYRW
jgi:hypothetical protein